MGGHGAPIAPVPTAAQPVQQTMQPHYRQAIPEQKLGWPLVVITWIALFRDGTSFLSILPYLGFPFSSGFHSIDHFIFVVLIFVSPLGRLTGEIGILQKKKWGGISFCIFTVVPILYRLIFGIYSITRGLLDIVIGITVIIFVFVYWERLE